MRRPYVDYAMSVIDSKKSTMTSLEIAEITGKKHAHVMRDIRLMVDALKKTNESTSGLVGSEYHRGDGTQYKFLSEASQNILLNFAIGESDSPYQISQTAYIDAKGETRAMYNLNKKACLLLASGYDVVLRAKIIDRWEYLEKKRVRNATLPDNPQLLYVQTQVYLAEAISHNLRLSDASRLGLYQSIAAPYNLAIPQYVPSKGVLKSATVLLREMQSGISAVKFNQLLEAKGYLETLTRPSSSGKIRVFRNITDKGKPFGENEVNPKNQKETQPHWYADRFRELYDLVTA